MFGLSPISPAKYQPRRNWPAIRAPVDLPFRRSEEPSGGVSGDRFPLCRARAGYSWVVPGFPARGPDQPICRNTAKAVCRPQDQRSWPMAKHPIPAITGPIGNTMVSAWIAIKANRGDRSIPPMDGMRFRIGRNIGSAMAPNRFAMGW